MENGRISIDSNYLKSLRRKHGLSQDKLADLCSKARLCVSISSIKRAESGKKLLYRTVVNLAKFFNVTVENLIGEEHLLVASLVEETVPINSNSRYVLLELDDQMHWSNLKAIQNEKNFENKHLGHYLNGLLNNNKVNIHIFEKYKHLLGHIDTPKTKHK